MRHSITTAPIRVHDYDDALRVSTSRTVAHRPVCSCGWKGSGKRTVAAARAAGDVHRFAADDLRTPA